MKVGTDGVLIGAWVDVSESKTILDIGTGSGLIALMLAQRTTAEVKIDGIEIETESALQAQENITQSAWAQKIKIHSCAIQDFNGDYKYDLIVSNPPYFINSLAPPSGKRKEARHTSSLSYEDLLISASRLLSDHGRLAVILPVKEGNAFLSLAQFQGLYCSRQLAFFSREGKPQERWLFEFSRLPQTLKSENLTLFNNLEWSEAYKKLVFDFYIHKL